MINTENIKTKNLDHLGIVAGVCDELGLVSLIDEFTQSDEQRKVSVGTCIYSMVLNGLGFANSTLYLTPEFFEDKALDVLIGEGIKATDLNSHSLSSALDAVHKAGIERLFFSLSLRAIKVYGVEIKSRHLDGTNFSVHGEKYKEGGEELGMIELKRGYNKQGRHDLKQFVLEMISCNVEGIPLFIKAASGNKTDKTEFPEVLTKYIEQLKSAGEDWQGGHYVADSALYSEETLQQIAAIWWISRVPGTIKQVENQLGYSEHGDWQEFTKTEGYKYQEVNSRYGGLDQRWLIVWSDNAYHRSEKTVERWVEKQKVGLSKRIKKLQKASYESETEAKQAVVEWYGALKEKEKRYHRVENISIKEVKHYGRGRRKPDTPPRRVEHKIEAVVFQRDEAAIEGHKRQKAKFILATNDMDRTRLTPDEWLHLYKNEQQKVERGFRFLKDPMFLLDYIFLKLPRRIMALSMVMVLCLLVYTLAQFKIRKALEKEIEGLPNQLKKPTKRPTMRWLFTLMRGIHVMYIETTQGLKKYIVNLNEIRIRIIKLMGTKTMAYYMV